MESIETMHTMKEQLKNTDLDNLTIKCAEHTKKDAKYLLYFLDGGQLPQVDEPSMPHFSLHQQWKPTNDVPVSKRVKLPPGKVRMLRDKFIHKHLAQSGHNAGS